MATSKTLAPTNVTISIPAMTDAPNASVISNCLDKEADAINALNSQITNLDNKTAEKTITKESQSSDTTLKFTFTGNRYTALVFKTDNMSANSGIYAITFKASGVTTIDKLSGSSTLPTVDSDGSINVGVHAWSKVTVMTDSDNYFS